MPHCITSAWPDINTVINQTIEKSGELGTSAVVVSAYDIIKNEDGIVTNDDVMKCYVIENLQNYPYFQMLYNVQYLLWNVMKSWTLFINEILSKVKLK